ncbi:MAG: tRNA 2-thiouridine(34) synthase MnmA [Bacilli bacterium]|jgi:tRNA-specific 2-thiouridylase|nr:tRNA 2-thiouridine(34) synthase MnmA [Bacilli bacterium]
MKKRVMLGLSGGVDSAVAAYLLKEQGYEVIACFMRNWDAMANNDYLGNPTIDDDQCPQEKDYEDALSVAKSLDIPLLRIDFVKEYWNDVFTYFLDEYQAGRTPNPDVFCNKFIKFDVFYQFALQNDCSLIAMGHYAKRVKEDGHFYLAKAKDFNKDQTYFLSQLNEQQIEACLFPLGELTKDEVRIIAQKLHLSIATKKDSTGICFIGERHFKQFLHNYLPAQKGDIVDISTGQIIGAHSGAMYYTIGQHRGLGIGGIPNQQAEGWYVVKKDVIKNIVYVTSGSDNSQLLSDYCLVTRLNEYESYALDKKHVKAKFRYRSSDVDVYIEKLNEDTLKVTFTNRQKAIATGQAAVFYDGSLMVGGGLISEVYRDNKRIDK